MGHNFTSISKPVSNRPCFNLALVWVIKLKTILEVSIDKQNKINLWGIFLFVDLTYVTYFLIWDDFHYKNMGMYNTFGKFGLFGKVMKSS